MCCALDLQSRPFLCPYCQKTFKTSVNCKKHMKTHRQEIAMQQLAGSQLSGNAIAEGNAVSMTSQQIVAVTSADGGLVDASSSYMQEVELVEVSNVNHGDSHLSHLDIDPQQIATLVQFQHQTDLDQELGQASLMASQAAPVASNSVIHDFQNILVADIQLQNALNQQVSVDDVLITNVGWMDVSKCGQIF
jgi:hypothetical protein